MPDWLIEHGIGETRAALVDDGEIVEARIMVEGQAPAGTIIEARLKTIAPAAIAMAGGQEYILSRGAPGVAEGGRLNIEVTREIIHGAEPWKRPHARMTTEPPAPAPEVDGRELPFPAPVDAMEDAGWSDLLEEARRRIVEFPGGQLRVDVTPAMTLIDIDGTLPSPELAVAGARAAAKVIRRHGIGGSIGIDLPVKRDDRATRKAAADAIDTVLPKPFERTSVNGFGFLQIIRRRAHSSLFELAMDRTAFEARALLRRMARWKGALGIVAHPAVLAELERHPEWIDRLSRQVGGPVSLCPAPTLPMSRGYAEPG